MSSLRCGSPSRTAEVPSWYCICYRLPSQHTAPRATTALQTLSSPGACVMSLPCHERQGQVVKSILIGLLCVIQAHSAISSGTSANAASVCAKSSSCCFFGCCFGFFFSICLLPFPQRDAVSSRGATFR